jgi:hypothetical protein
LQLHKNFQIQISLLISFAATWWNIIFLICPSPLIKSVRCLLGCQIQAGFVGGKSSSQLGLCCSRAWERKHKPSSYAQQQHKPPLWTSPSPTHKISEFLLLCPRTQHNLPLPAHALPPNPNFSRIFLYFSSRSEDPFPQSECFEWRGVKIRHYFSTYFFQNSFCLLFLLGAAIGTQFGQIVRTYFV